MTRIVNRGFAMMQVIIAKPMLSLAMVLSLASCSVTLAQPAAKPAEFATLIKPFFTQYCIKCDGPSKTKGEIALNTLAIMIDQESLVFVSFVRVYGTL
jgi:hypothetical protein